jgi:hypothetical protein
MLLQVREEFAQANHLGFKEPRHSPEVIKAESTANAHTATLRYFVTDRER